LAVWFTCTALFRKITEAQTGPIHWFAIEWSSLDVKAAALAAVAAVLVFALHRGLIETVAIMAALGIAVRLTLGA
jgi:chromate transporter